VSLAVLTCAAWALTLYRALRMSTPMDGMSDAAMSDMGMSGMGMSGMGISQHVGGRLVVRQRRRLLGGLDGDDGGDDAPGRGAEIVVFASAQARREPSVVGIG
jgi:hypothetical protein